MFIRNHIPAFLVLLLTQSAFAAQVSDIARLAGARTNVLTGIGVLETVDNPAPLKGVVRGGAVMEADVLPRLIDDQGRFQLILDDSSASWSNSSTIAKLINESVDTDAVAIALNPKCVTVQIPPSEQLRPDSFVAQVLRLSIPWNVATPAKPAMDKPAWAPPGHAAADVKIDHPSWALGGLLFIGLFLVRRNKSISTIKRGTMHIHRFLPTLCFLLLAPSAFAVKIADITRMDGARTNVITGMGLVMGLKGTGDGGAYLPAMRPLQQMLMKYDDASSLGELNSGSAANVAIVTVYATLPATGVHNGDTVDVNVVSMGAATSLKNGVLFMAAMNGPTGKPFTTFDKLGHEVKLPFALAKGELELDDNPVPLKGVIRGGAVMEVDLPPRYIDETGRFKLNINQPSASWAMSSTIAKLINEASDTDGIAVSLDPNTVLVQIPDSERKRPDGFIARILALPIPPSAATEAGEARVLIDDRTGTMIITGDVEISPVVISHKGLTITAITPSPVPTARNPLVQKKDSIPLDTTNQGGARLKDLADAFDQLKVPTEDRIAIVKDLYDIGKLHAKMTINGQER